MFGGLFKAPVVQAVQQALATGGASGLLLVVGDAALATALGGTAADISTRAAKRQPRVIGGARTSLEAPDGQFDAVIGAGAATDAIGAALLAEWSRLIRDGGLLVMVDRADETAATRRALCAGLADIEQRVVGRTVVTSGFVTR